MDGEHTTFFANGTDATQRLADALGAKLAPLPPLDDTEALEVWRAGQAQEPPAAGVVVALWPDVPPARALVDQEEADWCARFETPWLAWNLVLGAAARRVADDGSIVAVLRAPAALDASGRVAEMALGDGVVALIRSLASSEGSRGVRANVVTTPIGLVPDELVPPLPPLPGFPGEIEREVAGAVRLLLSNDSVGVTGRALVADCGRSQP